ncbi:hypothetical protein HJC23_011070 [Cyclotella cryptica]|uniref:Uncharacterized protein n=1 Tax=Cyclotella cryptica TaxID=29204 RepID=A0ABD3NK31_9STRA|eukprot:CCRYP_020728-RA/>CCRYP_020728-RA protein AED:0.01 eAED:0.01 QI:178/1/1/1/1/1/2/2369/318
MKLLGNQQTRYVNRTLESISKNDPNLVNVVLNGFAINEAKLATLAMALLSNQHVKSLYLHNVGINAKGANLLAFMLRSNKTLKHLSLNDNKIGSEGCAAIAASLRENCTLVTLGLSNNSITSKGAKYLSNMLKENREQTSLTRIFLDGNDDVSEKIIHKINRYCLKVRSKCPSSNKSYASTPPCSDVGSNDTSEQDHKDSVGFNLAGVDEGKANARKAEYDLFKEVIGYESVNSLHESLNASNLASYIERVQTSIKHRNLEEELGCEYFASNTDLGESFLSAADDGHDHDEGKRKEKHVGYFKSMKWPATHRKVHTQD